MPVSVSEVREGLPGKGQSVTTSLITRFINSATEYVKIRAGDAAETEMGLEIIRLFATGAALPIFATNEHGTPWAASREAKALTDQAETMLTALDENTSKTGESGEIHPTLITQSIAPVGSFLFAPEDFGVDSWSP